MVRYFSCVAAALIAAASLRAGELDAEFGPKSPAASAAPHKAVAQATPATALGGDAKAAASKGSELDGETPTQCWGCGWGGCGWRGCGWGGYGYGGGWGGYGYGGWGGYGGYGYGWGGYGYGGGWRGCGWEGYGWGGAYYPSYVSYGYYGYPGLSLYW